VNRFILSLLLLCASLPSQAAGLFDLFNPVRNAVSYIGETVAVRSEVWEPQFESQAKVYPPYKQDGRTFNDGTYFALIRKREFATEATAQWLAKEFKGVAVQAPYAGQDGVVMRLDPPRKQWCVVIDGVLIPAGHIAWWYTVRPAGARDDDSEAGYWPYFTDGQTRMKAARSLADMFIKNSVQFGVRAAWLRMEAPVLARRGRPQPVVIIVDWLRDLLV
jgi:hypothetical protein